jgi:FlaA1/EpsC-like NDP-sugar epimerase
MRLDKLRALSTAQRRRIVTWVDFAMVMLALAAAAVLHPLPALSHLGPLALGGALLGVAAPTFGILFLLGLPAFRVQDLGGEVLLRVAFVALYVALVTLGVSMLFGLGLPLQSIAIFAGAVFACMTGARMVLFVLAQTVHARARDVRRVLIYGAGNTGRLLAKSLRMHESYLPVGFVDDNAALHGLTVAGYAVHPPAGIERLARETQAERVLIAIPSLSPPRRAKLVARLEAMGLSVEVMPSFAQLLGDQAYAGRPGGRQAPADPVRLLGRAEEGMPLGADAAPYEGRSVLVSGAGGTIGAELCRKLLECRPERIVMFELSEHALYNAHRLLQPLAEAAGVAVVPVLGSVTDRRHVAAVLARHHVKVVLHAAAYKHVHLVQENALAGLANNVLGTRVLAREAQRAGAERFILVSSDKAVRPMGVMGGTKRLAEMVVQDLASRVPRGGGPIFSMVRFGNVLGSSGSVIPLWEEQIAAGGPVTVTDARVTRYFMTVQEAVRLVLRAGSMARGGEVFVLDMGTPMRMLDVARTMIERAGYVPHVVTPGRPEVEDEAREAPAMQIRLTGLREGEKLTEELLIGGDPRPTAHPKIFRVQEGCPSALEIEAMLRALRAALTRADEAGALELMRASIEGFGVPLAGGAPTRELADLCADAERAERAALADAPWPPRAARPPARGIGEAGLSTG